MKNALHNTYLMKNPLHVTYITKNPLHDVYLMKNPLHDAYLMKNPLHNISCDEKFATSKSLFQWSHLSVHHAFVHLWVTKFFFT